MKLIEFECDVDQIQTNQAQLSDTIKHSVYEESESLFDLLEFSNDRIFLEPSLFCFFLSETDREKKMPLEQSLFGYIHPDQRPKQLHVASDRFGLVNLPNCGYFATEARQRVEISTAQLLAGMVPDTFVDQSPIRLCLHPTDHLALKEEVVFHEPPAQSLNKNRAALSQAIVYLQKYTPEFWKLLELVTREIVVFSSPNHNSFAGIGQHGTSYLNVEHHLPSMVFFAEDLAHQCGHIIFNALTLDTDRYLNVPKTTTLFEIKKENSYDKRNVYGAFHGLFTYTCIVHCLDGLLESKIETSLEREAVARLGFFLAKFGRDLDTLHDPRILTDEGMFYHEQFRQGYSIVKNKYEEKIYGLDYSNQPYIFQYDKFELVNTGSKIDI